jgi:ribosomal protein L7Ae-like RNA K-turn-binding protein
MLSAVAHLPAISMIMPFEPKMSNKAVLQQRVRNIFTRINDRLKLDYHPEDIAELSRKLNRIATELDYLTFKKSVAIFVSSSFEKVFYLDISVEERVTVDDPFDLKDLVHNKKESQEYLVLVLNENWSRIYLGSPLHFEKIVSNVPRNMGTRKIEFSERTGNSPDLSNTRELVVKEFLDYTDKGLSILLQAYPLPLFVMAPEKILGYFKALTTNQPSIIGIIKGNFENTRTADIRAAIAPHVADWRKVKQKNLRSQLDEADKTGKLVSGLSGVKKVARHKKGKLLLIEENYADSLSETERMRSLLQKCQPQEIPFYITDAVDEIIESVLQRGGDVEFVDNGFLNEFKGIAMILEYKIKTSVQSY